MSWYEKLLPSRINREQKKRSVVPEGLWEKCSGCERVLYSIERERHLYVCPSCGHHERISARQRLTQFLDKGEHKELGSDLRSLDILRFRDSKRYRDRLDQACKKNQDSEALLIVEGHVEERPVVAAAFNFHFLGGSMGSVVGERFVRAIDQAVAKRVPLVCFSASGGARMQEGLFSLLQMAKTSAAVMRLRKENLPYISVLTDPTMGGVSASLAMLGDIIIAEPKALIGFAGPRVIEQTVHQTLPQGFQSSEFLLQHGAIDMIVDRREMRSKIAALLLLLSHKKRP